MIGVIVVSLLVVIVLVGLLCVARTGKPRFTGQWEADYEGHHIVVRTWFNPLLQGGEELVIDGIQAPKTRPSRPRLVEELSGKIRDDNRTRSVQVYLLGKGIGDFECIVEVEGKPITITRTPFDKQL